MNFNINENKLENVIFRFLDLKELDIVQVDTFRTFFISDENESKETKMIYRELGNYLYIVRELFDEIKDFFSLDSDLTKKIISKWVENKLNTNVLIVRKVYLLPND